MFAVELVPYLPELVVEWFVRTPEVTQRQLEGTVVYVDISGFTRLSERLPGPWEDRSRRGCGDDR